MNSWTFLLVGVIFVGMGGFTTVLARKNMRFARAHGQPIAWYKNRTLLTGFEYLLLGLDVFLDQLKNVIPGPLQVPFAYFFGGIILLTVILLLTVVFLMLRPPRQTRQDPKPFAATQANIDTRSPEERAADAQRKRERRQKAAAARRRQAGRA